MSDFRIAKNTLNGAVTLAIVCGADIITSDKRGIAPLVDLYDSGKSVKGYCAADRVVGRAAAFLYVLLGVEKVYAEVISQGGKSVLDENGIQVEYKTLTENIINRNGDGLCPMEQAVKDLSDAKSALFAVKEKLSEIRKNTNK